MKIVVTGSSGYIGSKVCSFILKNKHQLIAASREPNKTNSIYYNLFSAEEVKLSKDVDLVIHLAVNNIPEIDKDGLQEINAAKSLLKSSKKVGARFIFISSQTARSDAPSEYGRIKWQIEQEVKKDGGTIIRPGQVYGGDAKGLFGSLIKIVNKSLILPKFLPNPNIQPIHIDDLCNALINVIENEISSQTLYLGASKPISFSKFLSQIAKYRLHKRRLFIPVPIAFVKVLDFFLGRYLRQRLKLDQLNSLFNLPIMDSQKDLKKINISLRDISCGMHPSGNCKRRKIAMEGRALFIYICKYASPGMIARYVRAVETMRDNIMMDLPEISLKVPAILTLFDNNKKLSSEEFVWRLNMATLIAENTTGGAKYFLGVGESSSWIKSSFGILHAITMEIFYRFLGIIVTPFIKNKIK